MGFCELTGVWSPFVAQAALCWQLVREARWSRRDRCSTLSCVPFDCA